MKSNVGHMLSDIFKNRQEINFKMGSEETIDEKIHNSGGKIT